MITARQVAAAQPAMHAVSKARHLAVLQAVGTACELGGVLHAAKPSAMLEGPNGTGMEVKLDLLMRDAAGTLIGIDATIGMWDKEVGRAHHVHAALGGGWPSLLPLCGNPVVAQVHYPGPAFKDCITTGDMAKVIQAKTNNPWRTTTHSSAVPALAA